MGEGLKIVITVFGTLTSGIFIFVLQQTFVKIILEPCFELKKALGEVVFLQGFYRNFYNHSDLLNSSPEFKEELSKASKEMRTLAFRLKEKDVIAPKSWIFRRCFGIPNQIEIKEISGHMIGYSNHLYDSDTWGILKERDEKIETILMKYKLIS